MFDVQIIYYTERMKFHIWLQIVGWAEIWRGRPPRRPIPAGTESRPTPAVATNEFSFKPHLCNMWNPSN